MRVPKIPKAKTCFPSPTSILPKIVSICGNAYLSKATTHKTLNNFIKTFFWLLKTNFSIHKSYAACLSTKLYVFAIKIYREVDQKYL